MAKERIDKVLVERGLAETRQKAQALILAGQVRVEGQSVAKPGERVDAAARIEVLQPLPYVSRGGLKLEKALRAFGITVAGRIAVDLGASTGGFTDCLLKFGAGKVYAMDVGRGQLDWKLRNDPRVIVREGRNVRHLTPEDIPEPFSLVTMDLSFISVTLVLPALVKVLPARAPDTGVDIIVLIKPQFEVGKGQVGRGGIVKDEGQHEAVIAKVTAAARALGLSVKAVMESPIRGAEGNKEFLVHLVWPARPFTEGHENGRL